MTPSISHRLSGLPGTLNGTPACLLADSGSGFNVVTKSYALKHCMQIDMNVRDISDTIPIANGNSLHIIGRTVAEWSFRDSPDYIHYIDFEVVSKCIQDVIVGYDFLQKTGSFEEQKKSRFREMQFSRENGLLMNRIGIVHHRLPILARPWGRSYWAHMQAFPDTGAQGNIMSAASVHVYSLTVRDSDTVFVFPDGTEEKSLGRVKLQLSFGRERPPITTFFEIMRHCPHDVILGHDFVFNNHVYSDHAHLLKEASSDGSLNLITLRQKKPKHPITEGLDCEMIVKWTLLMCW